MVVEGAAITWKRAPGIDIEVVLGVTLAITAKSAFETEIVVSVVVRALGFEVGAVDRELLIETDVISELLAMLAWEVGASALGPELAGELDVEDGIVDVGLEAAEVAIAELVGLLDLEVGVADTALDSVEEVGVVDTALDSVEEVGVTDTALDSVEEVEVVDTALDSVEEVGVVDTALDSVEEVCVAVPGCPKD